MTQPDIGVSRRLALALLFSVTARPALAAGDDFAGFLQTLWPEAQSGGAPGDL